MTLADKTGKDKFESEVNDLASGSREGIYECLSEKMDMVKKNRILGVQTR